MSRVAKKSSIYLDNAASTPVSSEVLKEMNETSELYGNPSSFNDTGRAAKRKLEQSRLAIARFLGARAEEVVFTSSGSEANNMAILGLVEGLKAGEILTTDIEHPSVKEPLRILKNKGWKVTSINIDRNGLVDLDDLERKLNSKVILVSVMYANNEIGTIEPIKEISKTIKEFNRKLEIENWKLKIDETKKVLFHTDACQATEYLDMNVNNLGVDLLTFNGTKIYGPRGVGALYIRRGVRVSSRLFGGEQERGLRAGTENLPGIAGLAKALTLIEEEESERVSALRDYFLDKIKLLLPDVIINGPLGNQRLPNNINISIKDVDSEALLLELDKHQIYAGSGSACTSHSVEPSHVLKAIGVDKEYIGGALRLSLGRQTSLKDIKYVLKVLPEAVRNIKRRQGR